MGLGKNKSKPTKKLGRIPNDPSRARVELKALPGVTLTPPASANWVGGSFPVSELGMLGNDNYGDCVFAGGYHAVDVFEFNGQNVTTNFTDAQVLADYSTVTGFNPKDPNTDQGATLQEGLDFWRKTGFGGYKIAAFAQIDNTNLALVQNCIALFGVVYAGLNVPSSAMTQFDQGQPWSVVSRSRIEGGHCVPLVAYDASSFTCITWAALQKLTAGTSGGFYERYFDETWVPISLDWMRAAGTTPSGLDVNTANADYMALTGQPGPFQQVVPVTPPPVVPPVVPPVNPPSNDAAVALLTSIESQINALFSAQNPPHHGH